MEIFIILIFSFLLSFFLTSFLIKPFTKFVPDVPNSRSSHNITKPRAGGVSFILSTLFISLIIKDFTILYFLPLSIVGLLDDIKNCSRKFRLITQLITVFILLINSTLFNQLNNFNIFLNFIFIIFAMIILTGIINFFNFMDGIDGILCGTSIVILSFSTFLIPSSLYVIIGSLIGFLVFNWSPSKIFMGDIGSNFLGTYFIWVLLNSYSFNNSFAILLIASPIILDPAICLVRRAYYKQNIFEAHSLHLYQRLNQSGISHSGIALLYILSCIFIGISLFLLGIKLTFITVLLIIYFGFWLDKKYSKNFLKK